MTLRVAGPDGADAADLNDLADDLRGDLLDAGHRADRVVEPVPDGAKPIEVFAIGALVVAVAPSVVDGLFATLNAWLERRRSARSIEFEIDGRSYNVTAGSPDDLRRMIRIVRDELEAKPDTAPDG